MTEKKILSPEERAQRRAGYLAGFLWHAGVFVIINAFFWILNGLDYGGSNWSFWITLFWGFALAFHGLAYLIDGRQLEERKAQQYLEEERRQERPGSATVAPDEVHRSDKAP